MSMVDEFISWDESDVDPNYVSFSKRLLPASINASHMERKPGTYTLGVTTPPENHTHKNLFLV